MDSEALLAAARKARKQAYAPYSGYAVGACVLTDSGDAFTGANVENASYGLTVCAERVAVHNAVSSGARRIVALAVVTEDGATPCGACRQVLQEFGPGAVILLGDGEGGWRETTLEDLLPTPFGHAE